MLLAYDTTTKEGRRKMYKTAYIAFVSNSGFAYGFCYLFSDLFGIDIYDFADCKILLPELAEYKPSILKKRHAGAIDESYWFPIIEYGKRRRREILKQLSEI